MHVYLCNHKYCMSCPMRSNFEMIKLYSYWYIQCILNFINNFTYNWNFTMNACMGILILMLCVYAEPYLNSPKLHKFDMIFFGKALYTRVYIYMLPIGSTSIVLNCWHVKERVKTDSETFPYTYMYGYYTQLKKMPILFYLYTQVLFL